MLFKFRPGSCARVANVTGKFEELSENWALLTDETTMIINLETLTVAAEEAQDIELLSDGSLLYARDCGLPAKVFYHLTLQGNSRRLGKKYADGAYFYEKHSLTYRQLSETGDVRFGFLWCLTADINALNAHQVVCEKINGEGYDVFRMVGEDHQYLEASQACLIKVRVRAQEFVLLFNPERGYFDRIDLTRPSMIRRCDKIFQDVNYVKKNAKQFGLFIAPRTLGEFLYDLWEYAGMLWDKLYLWVHAGRPLGC